ncbi:MAG: 3-isopropylmalate dehydratase small subunit, partial [Pirellulales bacterium]
PVRLAEEEVDELFRRTEKYPAYTLIIDLKSRTLRDEHGLEYGFEVDDFRRHCLLNGLDDIGLTLAHEDKIAAYEKTHA